METGDNSGKNEYNYFDFCLAFWAILSYWWSKACRKKSIQTTVGMSFIVSLAVTIVFPTSIYYFLHIA